MSPPGNGITEELLSDLQRAFTDALLTGDESAAEAALHDGIEAGVDEALMDDAVIAPALRRVGDLWEAGELSIAEEHLATEIAMRGVALEREMYRVVRRRTGTVAVLAAVEGEHHVVGLRMAASLLIHAGYRVKLLGADVPTWSLGTIVAKHAPAVVGLSATMPAAAHELQEAIGVVRAIHPETGILVGGTGVPLRVGDQPGLRRCERLAEVVALVDGLTQRASMN